MDWIRGLVPVLVPVALGLLTAIFGGAFLTASRVRRDLSADVQLLAALPRQGRAGSHLNTSVQHRVIRLVGLVRYPPIAATDLIGAVGLILSSAAGILSAVALDPDEGVSEWLVAGWTATIFVCAYASCEFFYRGWCRRAAARFRFLSPLLDGDDVHDLALLLRACNLTIAWGAAILIVVPVGSLIAVIVASLGLPTLYVLGSWAPVTIICGHFIIEPMLKSELPKVTSTFLASRDKPAIGSLWPGTPEDGSQSPEGSSPSHAARGRWRRARG